MNIFDREWDLLVILDACRVDAMKAVAPEYDFIRSIDSVWSIGSSSNEWICKTFTTDYIDSIRETALISANPRAVRALEEQVYPPESYSIPFGFGDWNVVQGEDFGAYWHLSDPEYSSKNLQVPPGPLTDRAILSGRENNFERTIVHYMQPHIPHASQAYAEKRPPTQTEADPWLAIRTGAASRDTVWENYLSNLRLVLDSVGILLENFAAENVVITADHGELIGEWGAYGHPSGFIHPALKKVPWVSTSATDSRTRDPETPETTERSTTDIDKQLEALGYL